MEFSSQDDDFGGDDSAANATRASGPDINGFLLIHGFCLRLDWTLISHLYHSGNRRSFGDLEDDEDDIFGSTTVAPGVRTGMILSLRGRLLSNPFFMYEKNL